MWVEWDDLTNDQKEIIKKIANGSLMISVQEAEEAKRLGLAEQGLGGAALSQKGKKVWATHIAGLKRGRRPKG